MAYATPSLFVAGNALTAVQQNVLRNDLEEVAKPPIAWAYSTTNQTVLNGGGPLLTLAATYALRNVTFASNTFTIVEQGYYLAVIHVAWASNTVGIRVCTLNIGGVAQASSHITPGAPTNWSQQTLTFPFIGNAGNLLTASLFQDSGSSVNVLSGSSFYIKMLSRV